MYSQSSAAAAGSFSSIMSIRNLFPLLKERRIAYLDSAATTHKPESVIAAVSDFYRLGNANIHRGAYGLSGAATESYELARSRVASFLGAKDATGVIFTSGTTASLNFAAHALCERLQPGDAILLTQLEHHSNIVPWQLRARARRLKIEFARATAQGMLDLADFEARLAQSRPKIVACTAISNVLGTVLPIKKIIDLAHAFGALVVLDAAQAVAHEPINVAELDVDFLAFSAHKMYGPTGIGVLYGKPELLRSWDPVFGGGGMISNVTMDGSSYVDSPHRFEAGTPPIAEAIGLGEAVAFIESLGGTQRIGALESRLVHYAARKLAEVPGVKLLGPIAHGIMDAQSAILAFTLDGVHPHDVASVADSRGVCIRAGHHCAMPLHEALGVQSSCRLSVAVYNLEEEIDELCGALLEARRIFGPKR